MTSPLAPLGIAALGSLAVQTIRKLDPADFLRELCGAEEKSTETPASAATESSLDLSQAVPALIDKLRDRLPADVDLEQPLVLKEDGWGGVVVDGDHPDRLTIEELFAANQQLCEEFQALARAATSERDKAAADIGRSLGEFRLHIDGNNAAIGFE